MGNKDGSQAGVDPIQPGMQDGLRPNSIEDLASNPANKINVGLNSQFVPRPSRLQEGEENHVIASPPLSDEIIGSEAESGAASLVEESDMESATEEAGWRFETSNEKGKGVKRRLKKMKKIQSPCCCDRRLGGRRCKHLKQNGAVSGEALVSNRDDQISSDSEFQIRRSNRRLRYATSPLPVESPKQVIKGLIKVGNAIGIEFGNDLGLLSNLMGIGDQQLPC